MRVLFVGGPKDGEFLEVAQYNGRAPRKVHVPVVEGVGLGGAIFHEEVYNIEAIVVRGRKVWIGAHDDLELTDELAYRVGELLERNDDL